MILRRPHEFKIATLQDIRALFPPDWNPFYAGFGNRDTDEISYKEVRAVGVGSRSGSGSGSSSGSGCGCGSGSGTRA